MKKGKERFSKLKGGKAKECLSCFVLKNCTIDDNGCFNWNGPKSFGYGVMARPASISKHSSSNWFIHRFMLSLHSGIQEWDHKMVAMHKCDNRSCVNPDHLSWGTTKENVNDAINKKRAYMGERHHLYKLSSEDVENIKKLKVKIDQRDVARIFGISRSHVAGIQTGRKRIHDARITTS